MAVHQEWRKSLTVGQLLVNLLCLGFSLARPQHSQPYCYTDDTKPYRQFTTKTPYNYSRGSFSSLDLVPEGCVAAQAWHLGRHGTRYAGADDIARLVSELPGLQTAALEAHREGQGELCEGDVSLLAGWSPRDLNASWAMVLAPEGELELQGLASRYKAALPTLLNQHFSNDSFKFRHTATERTAASARAYSQGLFGDDSAYIPPALEPDPLLKFYDVCDKYKVEVDDNPAATEEGDLFWAGSEVDGVLDSVSSRLGYPCTRGELLLLYNGCRFYQAWQPARPSPWCVAFTPYDLKVIEYYYDLRKYYTAGYGYSINTAMACPPLQDVYQHFSDTIRNGGGPRGIFYFTHSKALITVMSRLGLFRDAAPLTHRHMDPERLWRTSKHGSFATNLAFTLSNCDRNGWWVSVAVDERMTALEGCSGPAGCSWEEFTQALSGSQNCDLDAICAVTPSGSNGAADDKGWTAVGTRLLLSIHAMLNAFLQGRPS